MIPEYTESWTEFGNPEFPTLLFSGNWIQWGETVLYLRLQKSDLNLHPEFYLDAFPHFPFCKIAVKPRGKSFNKAILKIFLTRVETWFEIPNGGQFCKNFPSSVECNNWVIWIRFGKTSSRLTEWGFWSFAILELSILFFVLPHYKMGYWNW